MATTTRKMTDNPVVLRIVELIRKQGKKEKDLTDYLGISPGTMSKWKYDGSFVYAKHLEKICEFLNTTPNYLFLGPEDEEDRMTAVEKKIIQTYRSLDNGRKRCIQDTLKYFASTKDESHEKPLL